MGNTLLWHGKSAGVSGKVPKLGVHLLLAIIQHFTVREVSSIDGPLSHRLARFHDVTRPYPSLRATILAVHVGVDGLAATPQAAVPKIMKEEKQLITESAESGAQLRRPRSTAGSALAVLLRVSK
ncbi:hypothetical protein EVAR_32704_1 [Eumeta japonica]|uniref:Uncharacterized protein n=1 Tax=Eumeta variegata TaxID=151549 RepID=A0A4C1VPR8_EUMVA|nr:hypothetical protein EVAR_32704_1 [Eumeta japonica]